MWGGFVLPAARTSSYDHPMRNVPNALLSLTLLASLSIACRPSSEPSADFEKASSLWVATVLDVEAPGADPRAEQALTLARAVPAKSIDADAAKALIKRIEKARADEAQAAADLQASLEPTDRPSYQPSGDSTQPANAVEEEAADDVLVVGMSEAAFKSRFGDCVAVDSPFVEARGTRKGQAFARVDSDICRDTHPELGDNLVYVLDGKVFNVAPRSAGIPVVETEDGYKPSSGDWPEPPPAPAEDTESDGDEDGDEDDDDPENPLTSVLEALPAARLI